MRLPPGWAFVLAALVWTLGGMLIDRDQGPRERGPVNIKRPPFTLDPSPPPRTEPSRRGDGTLPDISNFDPVINVKSGKPGRSSVGTAFPVDSRGVWLTARHVVDDCRRVGIYTDPVRRKGFWVDDITVHPKADIAVLKTKRTAPPIAIRPLEEKLAIGQPAYHFGYPQGEPGDAVSQLIGRRKMRKLGAGGYEEPGISWAVAETTPRLETLGGMSGGPVLDSEGRVLGVTVAGNLRRGRVLTSPPVTIHQTLRDAGANLDGRPSAGLNRNALNERDYPRHGDALRRQLSAAKVFCKGTR